MCYSPADNAEVAEIIASGILLLITQILSHVRFKMASFILFNVKLSVKIGICKGLYFLLSIKFTTFED